MVCGFKTQTITCKGVTILSPSKFQGPLTQQHTSDPYARGPSSPCKYEGFFKLLWSSTHYDQLVGPSTSSDLFKSFFIKQGSSWVSSTISTTSGDLQWSRYIKTSHVGLPDHLQALQHHQQGLQHLQQSGGFKIQPCGYRDLVNWYRVLQGTNPHCKGSKVVQGVRPLCKGSRHCRWDLVASMTSCGATASPCWHQ